MDIYINGNRSPGRGAKRQAKLSKHTPKTNKFPPILDKYGRDSDSIQLVTQENPSMDNIDIPGNYDPPCLTIHTIHTSIYGPDMTHGKITHKNFIIPRDL